MAILRGDMEPQHKFELLRLYREQQDLVWLDNETIRVAHLGSVLVLSKRGEVLKSKYRVPDSVVLSPIWNDFNSPHILMASVFKLNQLEQTHLVSKFIDRCYLQDLRKPFNLPFNHAAIVNLMGSYTIIGLR